MLVWPLSDVCHCEPPAALLGWLGAAGCRTQGREPVVYPEESTGGFLGLAESKDKAVEDCDLNVLGSTSFIDAFRSTRDSAQRSLPGLLGRPRGAQGTDPGSWWQNLCPGPVSWFRERKLKGALEKAFREAEGRNSGRVAG